MGSALNVLLGSINSQIKELNKSNFKIYDEDNRDYYITGIVYDSEDDKLIFKSEEEDEKCQ